MRLLAIIALSAVTLSCGVSNPQRRVVSLSTQQREKLDQLEQLAKMQQAAEAQVEAQVKAELRARCVQAVAVLRQDCKDKTALPECRKSAAKVRRFCEMTGMASRGPDLDSVECVGTGPFAALGQRQYVGETGLIGNYKCKTPTYPVETGAHSKTVF